MNAIILSVGDELVLGQTVDTNSAWISQQLAAVGCDIAAHATVPDNQQSIEIAIREAAGRCDFLIISGGIGPTEDDLTRQALAAVMGVELELNESWLAKLHEFFKNRARPMPETNKIQAMIPRGATMIENTAGTAAGIDATLYRLGEDIVRQEQAEVLSKVRSGAVPTMPPVDQLVGRPLGRVLTKMGRVTREQVVEALTRQKQFGGLIGEVLVQLGYLREADVLTALAAQKGDRGVETPPVAPASEEYMERMFGDDRVPPSTRETLRSIKALVHHEFGPAARVFVMPGVPKEMKVMFERSVLPHVKERGGGAVILSRTLHTFGLGESWVAEQLGTLMMRQQNPSVGTTVSQGIVSLRINARFESRERAQEEVDKTIAACREKLGDVIYGEEGQTLQEVVAASLASSRQSVTTAESCTGGLLSKMLTDVPGSSEIFKQGWIVYSNQAKYERLGVSTEIINVYGAVSEPVVNAMANNARRLAKSDYALAISGVAGPGGGSPTKPVGTVCIALAHAGGTTLRTFNFPGDREMIRDRAAKMALNLLRYQLMGKPMPV